MNTDLQAAFDALDAVIIEAAPEQVPNLTAALAARIAALAARGMNVSTVHAPLPASTATADDHLLAAPEVAEVLDVPVGQVREMMRQGVLPVVPVGKKYRRVRWSSLADWMARHEQKPLDRPSYKLYSVRRRRGGP